MLSTTRRHQELISAALAELNERRDQEQDQALTSLRQELKALVDAAYKERDEHLENYSKVRRSAMVFLLFLIPPFPSLPIYLAYTHLCMHLYTHTCIDYLL